MFSRRSLLAVAVALSLVAVSSATAEPIDGYTAAGSPAHVKPSTQATFTLSLTNKASSPKEADKAKIAIPAGFSVDAQSVQASATEAGECKASSWVADGTLIADGKIHLKSAGGKEYRLCPGATLTVSFSATSAATDGTYVWTTELLRDVDTFVLSGAQPSVRVDGTAPAVTINSAPTNPSNVTSPSFAFATNEAATLQCKLDGGSFVACDSPKSYSNLADGSHTFTVRATDAAGNIGTASHTWLIETTLPIVTLTGKPSLASKTSTASFSFESEAGATFQCKLDTGSFATCSSPVSYTNLPDGSHTFSVRATDTASNTGPETNYTWTVDTVAPTVEITETPASPSNDGTPTFAFRASEPVTFQCKLDTGAFSLCTSPRTYAPPDGSHTFTLRATDAAGNSGETGYAWTIDTVLPTVTITTKPTNPSNVKSPTFAFSANEAVSFQCKLDTGAFAACSSPKSYSDLAEGSHTLTVRATDGSGNAGSDVHTWSVDSISPTVTLTKKPNDPSGVNSAAFEFSAGEPATFQCRLDAAAFASCTSPRPYSGLPDGVNTFRVRATDTAGNTGAETTYEWLVETQSPVVELKATHSGSAATFFFTPNKPTTRFECKLDDESFATCPNPQSYSGLPDGGHTFAVRGIGTGGTGPATIYTWTIDTTGPTTAINEKPADPTNSRSASFAFSASEQATFQCKLDDGAFAACSSPQTYVNLGEGRHSFVVRALDALSNVGPETAHAWTIENRAPAISFASTPPSLGNSTSASFAFAADEPAAFLCSLDDRPFEPCSSPASYGGLRDGGHAFVVRAVDAAGNVGSASHAWTVDATSPETAIESAPARRTTATSATFAFSSSEAATFQCRLDDGSFSACSAPKTYRGLTARLHRFAVRAVDSAGNVDATPAVAEWTVGRPVTRTVSTLPLLTPTRGARVTRPPVLSWRPVKRATYYNVQLYRAGRKVLTAWPTRRSLQLRTQWRFNGRVERLTPGLYRWYVWPGYGRAADRRYGRLLGTSKFTVVGRTAARRG